jgi:2-oxo-4-hydroxy-4-carboxy-5-ureidoimidazoline decarboxylase
LVDRSCSKDDPMPAPRATLDTLNGASREAFVATLGDLFEHAPWVAEAAFDKRPFATVSDLHDAMMQAVLASPRERQIAFLKGHPDLAGKAARAGAIAAASVSEQAGLGLDRLSDAEYETFQRLNGAYLARFGFPFIVCVRRQTRDAVLASYEPRLANDEAAELKRALDEIAHITRLRLVEAVDGPGVPATTGHLSTHVLDSYHGEPGAGIRVELFEVGASGRARIVDVVTNTGGRTDEPLIHGKPLRRGRYELLFHTEAYFRRRGVAMPDVPFIGDAVLRFGIDQPEGRYHVPLVVTPWSTATYRGS